MRRLLLTLGVGAILTAAGPALAADRHWTVGSGLWNVSGNWSPAAVPQPADNAIVDFWDSTRGVGGEILSRNCFHRGRDAPVRIAGGHAYGLAAEIEPKQRAARRQVRGCLGEGNDQRRHCPGLA